MRELLLLGIVLVLCLAALIKPRLGLYGYIWFALMRPDALAWADGKYPLSMALAVATLAGSWRCLPNLRGWILNPINLLLLLLQVPIILSAAFARDPSLSVDPLWLYLRVIGTALLIPFLVQTREHLRELMLLMAASLGFLGAKFGLYGFWQGGVTLTIGHAGFLGDNNDFALALAMAVPLCWYSRSLVSKPVAKAGFVLMIFGTVAAIVMTHSRGAALALAAGVAVIGCRSRRKLLAVGTFLLLLAPAALLVRKTYVDRLSTLQDPERDSSALSRLIYARGAMRMWRDYPVLGVGFGMKNQMALWDAYMQDAVLSTPQVIHNTYLQVLVDSGTPALLLYLLLLFGAIFWLGRSASRVRQEDPGAEVYPLALQGSLIVFAVGCVFLSRVQFDLVYMLLMCAACWYHVQRDLRRVHEQR